MIPTIINYNDRNNDNNIFFKKGGKLISSSYKKFDVTTHSISSHDPKLYLFSCSQFFKPYLILLAT